MKREQLAPPTLSRRLLEWSSRRLETPELAGDAAELFAVKASQQSERGARRWYRKQARAALARVVVPRWRLRNSPASWLDVKLALRMLFKQPGLTLVAIFTLAIGIPVGLLPLHVLDSLTKPPPVVEADEIVMVRGYDRVASNPVATPLHDFVQWREELGSFEDLAMWRTSTYNVDSEDGRGAPVRGVEVTASIFSLLGVPPLLGRPLDGADEVVGAPQVVVIGYDLWRSRFAGNPNIIGGTIRIGAVAHTVVGVMPDGFLFPYRDHLWLPMRTDLLAYGRLGVVPAGRVMGRLADGVSLEDAQDEIETLGRRMAGRSPNTHGHLVPQVVRYTRALTDMDGAGARLGVMLTQTLAFLLLALACGNVGILILARAATRTRELAIRTALGASRVRIVWQLFVESFVLAVVAAGIGLLIVQSVASGPDWLLDDLPFWVDFDVSLRTTVLAISLAVASAAIAGVVPALKATGRRVQFAIQRASSDGSGIRFGKGYSALVVGEVAVSVCLLTIGSGLFPLALSKPGELGIEADQYLYAALRIPGALSTRSGRDSHVQEQGERIARAHRELIRRVSAEPGAGPVAIASAFPGMSSHERPWIQVEGVPPAPDSPAPAHLVNVAHVDVEYFDALGQPILSGRNFNSGDIGADRSAVIVNTSFVDRVLEGRNPIGLRVRYWYANQDPGPWTYEIVGVVGRLGMNALKPESDQGMYHAVAPGELQPVTFAVRVGNDPGRFAPRLRSIVADMDAGALLQNAVALSDVPNPERRILTLGTVLVTFLATIAVLLSAACLYALMSFTVAERTRECGIRTALGARPAGIAAAIARRAFLQLTVGVALGAAMSAVILSDLDDSDGAVFSALNWPMKLGVIALFVLAVGMLACAKPALGAIRIRPMDALRG